VSHVQEFLATTQQAVNAALERYLPTETTYPENIHRSMRYSVFAGGKRIRPALAIAAFELCGGKAGDERILAASCAIEMLHAFSLIHDDLPCMDDDDFRRGKPTNHRVFGEAVAVLGGDALCIHAFELLGRTGDCRIVTEISQALGTDGMIAGQVVDIESEGKKVGRDVLEYIHTRKTGAFIRASVRIGAMLASAGEEDLQALTTYGDRIGLAFQIADDILDVISTTEQIGKDAGSDEERGKITYPALWGLDESRRIARELIAQAKAALDRFGSKADLLSKTADFVVERVN
jgi:geranylgeranyl diphosphate synthase type II